MTVPIRKNAAITRTRIKTPARMPPREELDTDALLDTSPDDDDELELEPLASVAALSADASSEVALFFPQPTYPLAAHHRSTSASFDESSSLEL